MPDELRRNHHLVSKGYQRNFADGKWLAVLNAHTGVVVESRRSIEVNWRETDFLSVVSAAGDVDDSLEREFGKSERVFLNRIRDIQLNKPVTLDEKSALDALAATHAIRSQSFATAHGVVVSSTLERRASGLARDRRALVMFARDRGRSPDPGELEAIVAEVAQGFMADPGLFASGVRRLTPGVQQLLGKWRVQLVGSAQSLPGFILPDHPFVHGRRSEGRFGFRDAGAIGDADLMIVPINRRLVAFYSRDYLRDLQLRTKKGVRWVNSLLLKGAHSEVACHPDDAQETARLIRDVDRYPAAKFDSVTIR